MQLRSEDLLTSDSLCGDERRFNAGDHRFLSNYFMWDKAPIITVRTPTDEDKVQPINSSALGGTVEYDPDLEPTFDEFPEWTEVEDDDVPECGPDDGPEVQAQARDLCVPQPDDQHTTYTPTIPLIEVNLV